MEISKRQYVKHGERRRARVKALIIGANVGCVIATVALAAAVSVMGVIAGDIGEGLLLLMLYLFYGLLISSIFVNAVVWLILVPLYSKSAKILSMKTAMTMGLLLGPAYVLLINFTLAPATFTTDIDTLMTICVTGMLYGASVAYWCVRMERRSEIMDPTD